MNTRYTLVILILTVLTGSGCDSNLQKEFVAQASMTPAGITRTDDGGNLTLGSNGLPVEEDPDDWRSSPFYAGIVRFNPVHPNPANGFVSLDLVVTSSGGLQGGLVLRAYNDVGLFVRLDEVTDARFPGSYSMQFDVAALSASGSITTVYGLHRLYIFDRVTGELVSYGDLLVE